MKSENMSEIQKEFTRQAAGFASSKMNFTKQEYLDYMIKHMALEPTDNVLEVAAGTCICGRAAAPFAGHVTCLDMTPAMLDVGKKAAKKDNLGNMSFVLGDVVELPFADGSFDIVFSRLAFHHFPDIEKPFLEMKRVLKPGGKLIIIDMKSAEESLRDIEDEIEKLRDPSHVRNRSKKEFLSLYNGNGVKLHFNETINIPMVLDNWLEHAKTPAEVRDLITARMKDDIQGGAKTGFYPYMKNGRIQFDHHWLMCVGYK